MASSDFDVTKIDPSAVTPEDVKKLVTIATEAENYKKAMDAERNQRKELQKSVDTMKSELDEIKAAAENAESEKEKATLEQKGEYEAAKKKIIEDHNKALEAERQRNQALTGQLHTLMVENAVTSAAKNAVNPGDVYTLMRDSFKVEEKDGAFSVSYLDKDGTAALDDKGQPLTVDGAVETFLKDRPHLVKSTGTGGSGTTGGTGKTQDGPALVYPSMETI